MAPPTLFIDNPFGLRLVSPSDWIDLEYTRVENEVGTLVLHLPGSSYPRSLFQKDGLIEVWRNPDWGTPYIDTNTLWLIRRILYLVGPPAVWEITAYDLNHLLKRRVVDYNPGNTYTEKLAAADDLGKAVVRENLGTLATDTTRSLASFLTVQSDTTQAPVIRKSISRQGVLQVLQDVAGTSYENGTYLVFDITLGNLPQGTTPINFIFQSYVGKRGVDHSFSASNLSNVMYVGPDFGNLADGRVDEDFSDEVTRGISTGQGVDMIQAVARASDLKRINQSPYGLIEAVRSASGALVAGDLTADAQAELRAGIPHTQISGKLTLNSNLQYGLNWNWGDLISVQVDTVMRVCHIPAVHVKNNRDGGETVEPILAEVVASNG